MIRRIRVTGIPLVFETTRWQLFVFRLHLITCYTMVFDRIPGQTDLKMIQYWIYFGPKNLGIGFSFPRFGRVQ